MGKVANLSLDASTITPQPYYSHRETQIIHIGKDPTNLYISSIQQGLRGVKMAPQRYLTDTQQQLLLCLMKQIT